MKKRFLILLTTAIIPLIFFTQCLKPDDQPAKEVTKTTEMNISPSFNWSVTKTIDVTIIGIPGAADNRKTLLVYSDGQVYLKELYNINQNINRKLNIPNTLTSIAVSFNGFTQTIPIINGKVEFSFVDIANN
jgi:hypothetical protein